MIQEREKRGLCLWYSISHLGPNDSSDQCVEIEFLVTFEHMMFLGVHLLVLVLARSCKSVTGSWVE